MKKANVFVNGVLAGWLEELEKKKRYRFLYKDDYIGGPVSLTMPLDRKEFFFDKFPPFFEGLLPEGIMLEALLKIKKIDRDDNMSQLLAVGKDMVGYVSVEESL
jgi:serine/threonine-protein kinase HipA